MSSSLESNSRKWDEALVEAWGPNISLYVVARRFLVSIGVSVAKHERSTAKITEMFAEQGVVERAPKTHQQLCMNVRNFTKKFFPEVHQLLLQGKKEEALMLLEECVVSGQKIQREIPISSQPLIFFETNQQGW